MADNTIKDYARDFCNRNAAAQENFIQNLMEQFKVTEPEAEKVLRVFKKAKAVKYDSYMGRYNLTHGAFWSKAVIRRALMADI